MSNDDTPTRSPRRGRPDGHGTRAPFPRRRPPRASLLVVRLMARVPSPRRHPIDPRHLERTGIRLAAELPLHRLVPVLRRLRTHLAR